MIQSIFVFSYCYMYYSFLGLNVIYERITRNDINNSNKQNLKELGRFSLNFFIIFVFS